MSNLLAIDTGGTFTDFFLITPRGIHTHKVLSTPEDPSRAILKGIQELGVDRSDEIIHGSTVATNAFLERKGAKVGLIATSGFEDVIEIGRQNRPRLYDFDTCRTPSLVSKNHRWGLEERINFRGEVEKSLRPTQLKSLLKKIKSSGVESLAVALLFSYANDRHEKKVGAILKKLGIPVSLSSDICREYREFERTSTTCINAYVAPIMSRYLGRLKRKLGHKIRIMQSNGGVLSIDEASTESVRTLLSGPAGGALGAQRVAKNAGIKKVITLDMGGTSTDMALIDGDLELTTEEMLGGFPLKSPMIRIDTIGAGGGSIAWQDPGGSLRVGPQSAGAEPGPLCYGRGGKEVTLTDAHVYLGRIPPQHFLGGTMLLAPKKINPKIRTLAKKLKLSLKDSAQGILTVANANMARALRVLSLERGYDPREFTLLPFGGAGALHACELADALGIPAVLVPPNPGILSAFGMAHADWKRDYVQTVLLPEKPNPFSQLQNVLEQLKDRALREAGREGHTKHRVIFQPQLDVRYLGQSYELTLPLNRDFKKIFVRKHRQRYGFIHRHPLEVVNVRLQARVPLTAPAPRKQRDRRNRPAKPVQTTQLYWNHRTRPLKVFHRSELQPGQSLTGPAIIAEFSATTFLPPHWRLQVDEQENLILRPKT